MSTPGARLPAGFDEDRARAMVRPAVSLEPEHARVTAEVLIALAAGQRPRTELTPQVRAMLAEAGFAIADAARSQLMDLGEPKRFGSSQGATEAAGGRLRRLPEIAEEVSVSYERVRQVRAELDVGVRDGDGDWLLNDAEAAQLLGRWR